MNNNTFFLVAVFLWIALWVSLFAGQSDYTDAARTGDHPMLPKYEVEGEGYIPPFADRLGSRTHWTECNSTPTETKAQCVRRVGCITDSDCLEREDWLARHD